jgi:hypothetical protein
MLAPDPLGVPCTRSILARARELYRRIRYFIRGWLRD